MGLLDNFDDPTTMGLLSAGFSGLQAAGPSLKPVGAGQVLGAAGNAGINQMNEQKLLQMRRDALYAKQATEYGTTPFVDDKGNTYLIGKNGSMIKTPVMSRPAGGMSEYERANLALHERTQNWNQGLPGGSAGMTGSSMPSGANYGVSSATSGPYPNPGNAAEMEIQKKYMTDMAAKRTQATSVNSLAQEAELLLPKGHGSGIGNLVGGVNNFLGISESKNDVDAQLKVLGAALTSNVPRMEGPQSDKDVAMYREAAGQVGDASLPISVRQKALQTVKDINKRYAPDLDWSDKTPNKGSKFVNYNGQQVMAKRAPDGNLYIEADGKFRKVKE